MTEREFLIELRRGIIIILRACCRRFGLSMTWFLPGGSPLTVDQNASVTSIVVRNATRG